MRCRVGDLAVISALAAALLFASTAGGDANDSAFDKRGDVDGSPAADLRKLTVVRQVDNGLEIRILTAGILQEHQSVEYWIFISLDGKKETGERDPIASPSPKTGKDLVVLVPVSAPPPECGEVSLPVLLFPPTTSWANDHQPPSEEFVVAPGAQAVFRTACMAVSLFDKVTNQYRDARVPSAQALTVHLPKQLIVVENTVQVQVVAKDLVSQTFDAVPDNPQVFRLKRR